MYQTFLFLEKVYIATLKRYVLAWTDAKPAENRFQNRLAFNLTPVYLMTTTLRRVSKLSHGFLHVSTRNRKSKLSLRLLIRKVDWTAQSNFWEDPGSSSGNRKPSVPNADYTEDFSKRNHARDRFYLQKLVTANRKPKVFQNFAKIFAKSQT